MIVSRGIRRTLTVVIARGGHDQHIMIVGIVDRVSHGVAITAAAQAEVDDISVMIHSMNDAFGHRIHAGAAFAIGKNLDGHQACAPAGAADAYVIIARGPHNPGHMRAVAIGVGGIAVVFAIIIPGVRWRKAIFQIGVIQINARIDNSHHDVATPLGHVPGSRTVDFFERPLIPITRVVGASVEQIDRQIGLDKAGVEHGFYLLLHSL